MRLPIQPPFPPAEAQSVTTVPANEPDHPSWQYEPKWDGFRCLLFRDHDEVALQSKAGQPLGRYFPELVTAARALGAPKLVLDGELVVPVEGALSFDALLQRIHPAESRIQRLAGETPARMMVFDLLVDESGRSWVDRPLKERRQRLEQMAKSCFPKNAPFLLSPATTDFGTAQTWATDASGDWDGLLAKRLDAPYLPGDRSAMQKIKPRRSADCVVGGFRWGTRAGAGGKLQIGSLLLGLYGDDGLLHHVGFTSSFPRDQREALTRLLLPLRQAPGFTGRRPGGPSRWSTARSTSWEPVAPRVVVEVSFDHVTGGRFRHGTKWLRLRPDKLPHQCTMQQLEKDAHSPIDASPWETAPAH